MGQKKGMQKTELILINDKFYHKNNKRIAAFPDASLVLELENSEECNFDRLTKKSLLAGKARINRGSLRMAILSLPMVK